MKRFIPLAIFSIALAGCMPPPYQSSRSSGGSSGGGDDYLRKTSMELATTYAKATTEFLKTSNSKTAIAKTQELAKKSLKDPESAQFRDVKIQNYGDLKIICGEINAKNSYGGYVGFKRFMGSPTGGVSMEDLSGKYPEINASYNSGLYAACGR